jgi:hypothetical protein
MNEHQLERILRRIARLSAPLPAALLAAACGGTTVGDPRGSAGESSTAGDGSGGASVGGSGTAGAGIAGGQHRGGSSSGGTSTGDAGATSAGTAGTTFAGAGGTGSAGAGGVSGAGAGGAGGAGGTGGAAMCRANAFVSCIPVTVTVPSECVPDNAAPGAALPPETCSMICGSGPFLACSLTGTSGASASVNCTGGCAVGRRPYGFCPSAVETRALGRYFAQLSELEAASVDAFRILRNDLRAQSAPKRLVKAAGRAARDEIRHARATRALARRAGERPQGLAPAHAPQRSLEAIAHENAIEGCVRETFGALLATYQADAATDPLVRAAMKRIGRDETRHAALSWQVQRWLEARLDPEARARVRRARSAAALELLQAVRTETTPGFAERIGLPAAPRAYQLATELARTLWS